MTDRLDLEARLARLLRDDAPTQVPERLMHATRERVGGVPPARGGWPARSAPADAAGQAGGRCSSRGCGRGDRERAAPVEPVRVLERGAGLVESNRLGFCVCLRPCLRLTFAVSPRRRNMPGRAAARDLLVDVVRPGRPLHGACRVDQHPGRPRRDRHPVCRRRPVHLPRRARPSTTGSRSSAVPLRNRRPSRRHWPASAAPPTTSHGGLPATSTWSLRHQPP